jgi:DNA-binding transcriptional regulator YhcF (GntR family)/AcrR family transcriptional regulator
MATYQTIAAELRQRIETGELRPGERVPSTRAITRQWGVAVATATRALQALQAEGLVTGVVGVGTVVAERPQRTDVAGRPQRTEGDERPQRTVPERRPARDGEVELTRERIVATAVAVADGEGLAAVTMRRLALDLGVAVMSLYRHVPSKDELVVLMTDHVLAAWAPPDPVPAGWRERIESVTRRQWHLTKMHPWMGSVMSLTRPMLAPNGMAQTDFSMGIFRELGFDPDTALQIELAIAGLLFGVGASLQLEVEAERETGQSADEWMGDQEATMLRLDVERRFPNLAAVEQGPDLDSVFELGLGLLLDGLSARLAPAGPGRAGA